MQEFGPLAGRVFGGGWAAAQHQRQQPAKCPRCESTNTKFCYYNNYNLAQPRHYCKSCRRHWTKGGVLRNVPVGGGCRKSKRGSSSSSSKPPSQPSASDDPSDSHSDRLRRPVSVPSELCKDNSAKAAISLPVPTPPDPPFEPLGPPLCPPPEIFPKPPATGFGFPDLARTEAKAASESTRQEAFADQAVPADPAPRGGAVALSGGTLAPQLFDLATAAEPATHWNHSHWMDGDHTLYLP
ncbi:uncharacterized protein LOC141819225 [Curcuma longa]|uniref:uncharacterized protein LOC141819225 n=1 Tax=Curcuma longa TaxID=136217 RepID=UPI003D9F30CD